MWKKSKLVLLSSALAFSLTCGATNFVALAADDLKSEVTVNITQNYVKVKYEDKVLFHEQVPSKTIVQVLNTNAEIIESQVLSGDTEIELDTPKISKGKMLSYWSIKREKDKLIIEPSLTDEKGKTVRFYTTEGGELLENNAQIKEITKSVNSGTNLKDVLPEVSPRSGYKFTGWFKNSEEKLKDLDDIKVLDSKGRYYAKFYSDINGNDIDDQTEEIIIKFVTNSIEELVDVNTFVGSQIKLPPMEKKGFIFMGWYSDDEFKNQFKNDTVTESITLYAKWEEVDTVIKESEQKPVTDKDVSAQIEKILNERLKGLNTNNSGSTSNSNNKAIQTPSVVKTSPVVKTSDTSIGTINRNVSDMNKEEKNKSETTAQKNVFKETKYVFDNKNLGQMYMVKFFDENETFLFSLTLPYGKTIKTYDENERLHDEYAVRQDTTITLNTKNYILKDSILLGYETREVKVNSAKIIEIYPDTKSNLKSANIAHENPKVMKEQEENKMKTNIIFVLVVLAAILIGGASIYLLIKKKKKTNRY